MVALPRAMNTLDGIRLQLSAGECELCRHALKRAVERNSRDVEIMQAGEPSRVDEATPVKSVQDVVAYS